jgi:hypothetical protein
MDPCRKPLLRMSIRIKTKDIFVFPISLAIACCPMSEDEPKALLFSTTTRPGHPPFV